MLGYIADQLNLTVLKSAGVVSLSVIEGLSPDLILMDNLLGESLGSNLCLEIKNNRATKNIPVIMISGQSNLYQVTRACCADGYIEKPIDLDTLEKIIIKFVGKPLHKAGRETTSPVAG
jgi:DNA-binding response OmpR family regulator